VNKIVIERCMESSLSPMKVFILARQELNSCGEIAYN